MMDRILLALALSALSASAAELRLGPDGDVRSPADALNRIREDRKSGRLGAQTKAAVLCAPGVYELTEEPQVFTGTYTVAAGEWCTIALSSEGGEAYLRSVRVEKR